VDTWESQQQEYITTLPVLEHFYNCLNKNLSQGEQPILVKLACGSDLLSSFATPGVWAKEDIQDILRRFGIVVLERSGSDARGCVYDSDVLYKNQGDIMIVPQWIPNDISSTKIRASIARGMSIKYLLPDNVVNYIHEHKLYMD